MSIQLSRRIFCVLLAAVLAAALLCVPASAETPLERKYDQRMAQLTSLLERDSKVTEKAESLSLQVAFLSVSDGTRQAKTVYAAAKRLPEALDKALDKAKGTGIAPVWLKLDVVTGVEETSYQALQADYAGKRGGSLRRGIAFNDYFGRALLDAQINSGGFLSYETGELDLARINTYFKENQKKQLEEIPETLYLFTTQGYFTDGTACRLTSGKYNACGRRPFTADKEGLTDLAKLSSSYLNKICGDDGKFVYGYYPIDNSEIDGYNIIRHGGTVWNLILQYDMTKDAALIPAIERSLSYLEQNLYYKDPKTAFLAKDDTLNIGGNGISLLAFASYAEIFGSDKYNEAIEALAGGILFMQKENGSFIHSIYKSDYSVHQENIIIYYDGEAMFGLLKAYGVLQKREYLSGAERAADYFIQNRYEEQNSHWISYAFNELTKYSPKEEYFAFGLRNVGNGYLSSTAAVRSGAHTRCEAIGAAFELYDRMKQSGVFCDEQEDFDAEELVSAFESRISYGLNYFMFPEYAMYFPDPQTVLNSFAVREDLFRIRIDDIQHFMGGYYLYWKNYGRIQEYSADGRE